MNAEDANAASVGGDVASEKQSNGGQSSAVAVDPSKPVKESTGETTTTTNVNDKKA